MTTKEALQLISDIATRALSEAADNEKIPVFRLIGDRITTSESAKTFGEWLLEWFEVYKKPVIKTWRNKEIIIRLHIPEWLKAKPLSEIQPIDVQRVLNDVPTSRNREDVYHVFTECLRQARIEGHMSNDVMLGLRKPKHKRERGKAFTQDEQAELLRRLEAAPQAAYFRHVLLTGSRPSEPLRLRPEDVDVEHGKLHIRGTKTDGADRYIPLFPGIVENLATVTPVNGRYFPMGYDAYQNHFLKLGFPGHSLKDLRHTFATRALEAGVSMKTVQLWLGHSTYEMTANTYSHVQPLYEAEQAAKFSIDLGSKKDD